MTEEQIPDDLQADDSDAEEEDGEGCSMVIVEKVWEALREQP